MTSPLALQDQVRRHEGALKPGAVWVDLTTGDPRVSRELADVLQKEHGVHFIDAGMSGGPHGARDGAATDAETCPRSGLDRVLPSHRGKLPHPTLLRPRHAHPHGRRQCGGDGAREARA